MNVSIEIGPVGCKPCVIRAAVARAKYRAQIAATTHGHAVRPCLPTAVLGDEWCWRCHACDYTVAGYLLCEDGVYDVVTSETGPVFCKKGT